MLAPPHFAAVTWDAARGRRACPLATFGARAPATLAARLVCVDPPRADCATVANAAELRGAVALVVRGGCSFALKARRVQAAGAVAMVLANNTRDEPFAAFTMGEEEAGDDGGGTSGSTTSSSGDEVDDRARDRQSVLREPILIPCVMMCLFDVRELFKQFPPTVKTGTMKIEVLDMATDEAQAVLAECSRQRQVAIQSDKKFRETGGSAVVDGGGWGGFRRWKAPSLRKLFDPQVAASVASQATPFVLNASTAASESEADPTALASAVAEASPDVKKVPLFAFVQWATSAESYEHHFAPLAEFGFAGSNAVYEGNLVACDPILADETFLRNGPALSNAIALVKRGACMLPSKLEQIQSSGAVAAIVGNDDEESPDAAFVMSVDYHGKVDHVTIPSVMVSFNLFQRLATEGVKFIRIICLTGDAAAYFMMNVGMPFMVADIPLPTVETGNEALHSFHLACREGDHGACQRILDERCSGDLERRQMVRACDLNRLTALHHACVGGNEHILSLLISLGASLDAADIGMQTPLHIACMYCHDSCVRALIKAGAGQIAEGRLSSLITKQNIGGSTPLHYAATFGSAECFEILLTANARVDQGGKYIFDGVSSTDHDGSTPLHVACKSANSDCVMYLIAANAELDAVDNSGYTPLRICCELANDPKLESASLRMIEKLVSAGARVSDSEGAAGALFFDLIESRALKRELETMYFRHEAHSSQETFCKMEREIGDLRIQLTNVQAELKSVVAQNLALEAAREATRRSLSAQQSQIDHLHAQMKTIIQILHSQTEGSPLPGAPASPSLFITKDPASPCLGKAKHQPEMTGSVTAGLAEEETLSQEAALARDLGRKFAREQKFAVAEMYFEKSLELFALPGVHRLLEQVRKLRHEAEQRKSLEAAQQQQRQQRSMSQYRLLTLNKAKLLQQLRSTLRQSRASERAMQSVEGEISKLEALEEQTPEFETTRKWVEWLVALPWGDPFSGLQNADLFASCQDVFEQINLLEQEEMNTHRHCAARVIQRAFREHFSAHILHRSIALIRIQAVTRGCITRRRFRRLLTEAQSSTGFLENQTRTKPKQPQDASSNAEEKQRCLFVDYSSTVDPAVYLRLRQARKVTVVTGVQFTRRTENENAAELAESSGFHVLQLLCSESHGSVSIAHDTSSSSSSRTTTPQTQAYYVWNRWRHTVSTASTTQCTLSGPYDDLVVANHRYDRDFRKQLQNNFVVSSPLKSDSALQDKPVRPDANPSAMPRTGDRVACIA